MNNVVPLLVFNCLFALVIIPLSNSDCVTIIPGPLDCLSRIAWCEVDLLSKIN